MDYMMELRKLVGHRPLIMVGATVFLLNPQNELLLMHRTDNGKWGPPGGSLNLGESLEECAARETLEETGIVLHEPSLFGLYSGGQMHYIYPNGDEVHMVTAVYLATTSANKVVLSHEHDQYQFFPLYQIPKDISRHMQIIINDYLKKDTKS